MIANHTYILFRIDDGEFIVTGWGVLVIVWLSVVIYLTFKGPRNKK